MSACEFERTLDIPAAFTPGCCEFGQPRCDSRGQSLTIESCQCFGRPAGNIELLLVEVNLTSQFLDATWFFGRFFQAVQQWAGDLHEFVVPAQWLQWLILQPAQAGATDRNVFKRALEVGDGLAQCSDLPAELFLVDLISTSKPFN